MADNVTFQAANPATPPAGFKVATDEIDGVAYQRMKLDVGADGVSLPVDADHPLPVSGTVTAQQGTAANLKAEAAVMGADGTLATVQSRRQSPTGNALNVQIGPGDIISNIPVVQLYDHHQLHEGETFRWSVYVASLANNASKDIRIVVPNITITTNAVTQCPHLRFEFISSVGGLAYLYEGTTFTGNGTARTPIAMERNGTYTALMQIHEDPTVNAIGTLLWQGLLLASKQSAGDTNGSEMEFVLKNNTSYLVRFTSAGNSNQVLIRLVWYEDLGV
jgi:hypothetical protein